MIDKHSPTWRAVEAFCAQERQDSIDYLIADRYSERQRGVIAVLDKLLALASDETEESLDFFKEEMAAD